MKRPLLAIAFATLLSAAAPAATEGTPGASSDGSLELTLNVTEPGSQIQITGFTDQVVDIPLGSKELTTRTQFLCIYMSDPGSYNLDWTAETLSDGTNSIPYRLHWYDNNFSNDFQSLNTIATSSAGAGTLTGLVPSTVTGCTGESPEIEVAVAIPAGDRNTPLDNATAKISITVTPQ